LEGPRRTQAPISTAISIATVAACRNCSREWNVHQSASRAERPARRRTALDEEVCETVTQGVSQREKEELQEEQEEAKPADPSDKLVDENEGSSVRHANLGTAIVERREVEQYFCSERTVYMLMSAIADMGNVGCLTTPALAQALHDEGYTDVALLDIDERFASLPGFQHFDLLKPIAHSQKFDVIVFDPPFFYIPLEQLKKAVLTLTHGRTNVPFLIAFLAREEAKLLNVFRDFGLCRTKFVLEYANVKESKWSNYALYSNVDLPGVKRIHRKR